MDGRCAAVLCVVALGTAGTELGRFAPFFAALRVVAQTGSHQNASASRPLPSLPLARLKPDAVLPLDLEPGAALTTDAIWVAQRHPAGVVRVDPKTSTLDTPVPLPHSPCASILSAFAGAVRSGTPTQAEGSAAAPADALWVPLCEPGTIARVDVTQRTVSATVPVGVARAEATIAAAAASIWVVSDDKGVVSRIDPATNAPVAEVYVAPKPVALAAAEAVVWVTSEEGDLLTRIDANTNVVVDTIKVGPRPGRLVIGEGAVWTLNRGDGSLSRVDPKTNAVVATVALGEGMTSGDIAAGEGAVWISAPGTPIVRLDVRTNRVTHRFTGDGGGAVVVGHGSVWIAAGSAQTWRIDPKLIAALRP